MIDDNISQLIKEAKPLYFARKRRNTTIKSILAICICILGLQTFNSDSDYLYNYDGLSEDIYLTENGSIIEDMGLPIDEYGLLKVV